MRTGLIVFAVVCVLGSWIVGAGAYLAKDSMGQFAGLLAMPMVVIPFIMAFIAHRITRATGNPFRGLGWGNTSWYFATWILGLLAGAIIIAITLGIGLAGFDASMGDYIDMIKTQSEARGQPIPAEAESALSITGYATAIAGPLIGPWLGALMGCLSVFPWFGWFGRRLLVYGRQQTVLILMLLFGLSSIAGGLVENPAWIDTSVTMRMVVTAIAGLAMVPAMLWIFLRTRSAVVTSLAQASYTSAFAGIMPFMSGANPIFAPPGGLIVAFGSLLVGIALWVWKDPGGKDLAVAAVAFDGTPLTPEQLAEVNNDAQGYNAPLV